MIHLQIAREYNHDPVIVQMEQHVLPMGGVSVLQASQVSNWGSLVSYCTDCDAFA